MSLSPWAQLFTIRGMMLAADELTGMAAHTHSETLCSILEPLSKTVPAWTKTHAQVEPG